MQDKKKLFVICELRGIVSLYDLGPLRPPQHASRACGVLRGLRAPPRHVCALNGHSMAPVALRCS